jgi:hypothetical protein
LPRAEGNAMKGFGCAAAIAWFTGIFAVMFVGAIASGETVATASLGLMMIGPIVLAVTLVPIAIASAVSWWLARTGKRRALAAAAIYLGIWTIVEIVSWVPPFGEPPSPEDISNAFWLGPVFAAVFGAFLALMTSSLVAVESARGKEN